MGHGEWLELEYKWFVLNNVVGEVTYTGMYYILDYLLEDVAEKVQAGLNDLPKRLPYYSTTSLSKSINNQL